MTTQSRQLEAERVEAVYYWAINRLGNAVALDSLELWKDVPATKQAARSGWWLARIIDLIFGFRSEANALAIAYYRLVRALRTGATIGYGDDKDTVSLEQLRQDFEDIVDNIDRETRGDVAPEYGDESDAANLDLPALEPGDDNDVIEVERTTDIDQLLQEARSLAEEEAAVVLDALGLTNFTTKLDQVKDDSPTREQDVLDAFNQAGNRQAAAAMRITLNAARGLVYDLADTDQRVIGWARFSRTGKPCGWCAMLISRGVVYKTAQAAGGKSSRAASVQSGEAKESDLYHDHCRCVAVPIFALSQYQQSALFDANRKYAELWRTYIKGKYSGDRALSEWRKIIRRLNAQAEDATPEAA